MQFNLLINISHACISAAPELSLNGDEISWFLGESCRKLNILTHLVKPYLICAINLNIFLKSFSYLTALACESTKMKSCCRFPTDFTLLIHSVIKKTLNKHFLINFKNINFVFILSSLIYTFPPVKSFCVTIAMSSCFSNARNESKRETNWYFLIHTLSLNDQLIEMVLS